MPDEPNDNNSELDFLTQFSDVTPLKKADTVFMPEAKDSLAKALKRREIELSLQLANNHLSVECLHPLDPYDLLSFKKSGVQEGVFKNLRLGKYKIEQVINLQNKKFDQARQEVFQQLTNAYLGGIRTILLKHGIGLHSKPFPAFLKSFVNQWLLQMPQVIAFHSAITHHGGSGATYVLLRKNDTEKSHNRELHRKK